MGTEIMKAYYHLPGLFEFYDFYSIFLPLWKNHREYFYEWCDIGSIYGNPPDCIWGGGRVEMGDASCLEVVDLLTRYGISARLTFSNSLLGKEHLGDARCNEVCRQFAEGEIQNGIVICSDILLDYLRSKYPVFYYVSSTTKVLTRFEELKSELARDDFAYVVPDFRLNKSLDMLRTLSDNEKDKIELLCNECCYEGCTDRKICYETVSRRNLGDEEAGHICRAPGAGDGYRFSKAMDNPQFIGTEDILNTYLPMGISNFKIEGRGLGSALLLEFILYYMTKPQWRLTVREEIYLTNTLDLF